MSMLAVQLVEHGALCGCSFDNCQEHVHCAHGKPHITLMYTWHNQSTNILAVDFRSMLES
eukprot:6778-Heterococcus_DN1.PRE.3